MKQHFYSVKQITMQKFICAMWNSVGPALKHLFLKTICPKRHLMTLTSAQ